MGLAGGHGGWPRNVNLGMFGKAGARGFRGRPTGACWRPADRCGCVNTPQRGLAYAAPSCLGQGIWNQLRGSGRPGTVTLAEAEVLRGQQPRRAGRPCRPESRSSLLEERKEGVRGLAGGRSLQGPRPGHSQVSHPRSRSESHKHSSPTKGQPFPCLEA